MEHLSKVSLEPISSDSRGYEWFSRTQPDLSETGFHQKWTNVLKANDGFMFFRSFVRAYYVDLIPAVSTSGADVIGFGDGHPLNFGFLPLRKGTQKLVYDDIDDYGETPIGFDIARFFTALRFILNGQHNQEDTLSLLAKTYFDVYYGFAAATKLSKEFIDHYWHRKKRNKKALMNDWADDTLFQKISKEEKDFIQNQLEHNCSQHFDTHGVRQFIEKSTGGSTGLHRYWAHVKKVDYEDIDEDILELKQLTLYPGTGGTGCNSLPPIPMADRVQAAVEVFSLHDSDYQLACFEGWQWCDDYYLIRSRTSLSGIKTKDLRDHDDAQTLYLCEVGIIASTHRKQNGNAFGGGDRSDWILDASSTLYQRWCDMYNVASAEYAAMMGESKSP